MGSGHVSFIKADVDENGVHGFTERFNGLGPESRIDRFRIPPQISQPDGQRLQCMQLDLTKPFPLNQEPVFIPRRQQIAGQRGAVGIFHRQFPAGCQQPGGLCPALLEISSHVTAQGKLIPAC